MQSKQTDKDTLETTILCIPISMHTHCSWSGSNRQYCFFGLTLRFAQHSRAPATLILSLRKL